MKLNAIILLVIIGLTGPVFAGEDEIMAPQEKVYFQIAEIFINSGSEALAAF